MKTTIKSWSGQSEITLNLMEATDGVHLAVLTSNSAGHSFLHAMSEDGLSKLICDACAIRNLMRVQPKIVPGHAAESGEFIPADELNKGKS